MEKKEQIFYSCSTRRKKKRGGKGEITWRKKQAALCVPGEEGKGGEKNHPLLWTGLKEKRKEERFL